MHEERETNIREFLKEFKKIMVKGRGLDIIPRRETMGALADLGLTKNNLKEEIMALSVEDYCEGPEPDRDRAGDMDIRQTDIRKRNLYKIKNRLGRERKDCQMFIFPSCKLSALFSLSREEKEG